MSIHLPTNLKVAAVALVATAVAGLAIAGLGGGHPQAAAARLSTSVVATCESSTHRITVNVDAARAGAGSAHVATTIGSIDPRCNGGRMTVVLADSTGSITSRTVTARAGRTTVDIPSAATSGQLVKATVVIND